MLPLEHQAPEDLTPEEARELVRRMRAQRETAVTIKPELKAEPEQRVKRQRSEIVALIIVMARKFPSPASSQSTRNV